LKAEKAAQQPEAKMMELLLQDADVRKLLLQKIRTIKAKSKG